MNPIVLAVFPGLLFSVQPPSRPVAKPSPAPVAGQVKMQLPTDTCNPYIYVPNQTAPIYYNGIPLTPEQINKLGPMVAPLRQGFGQESIG